MGEKYVLINGKHVKLDPNSPELKKKLGQDLLDKIVKAKTTEPSADSLGFGHVIEYKANGVSSFGKITGFNKSINKYIVSVATSKSKAGGFLFSGQETANVAPSEVVRKV